MKIVKGLHVTGTNTICIQCFSTGNDIHHHVKIYTDENGKTLQEHIEEFSTSSVKLLVEEGGVITSFSDDVTSIGLPESTEFDIVEIAFEDLPQGFTTGLEFMNWEFNGETIVPRVITGQELIFSNTQKKAALTSKAIEEITKLQVLEKYGAITAPDKKRLKALELALMTLMKIEPTDENINWPEI